jgi:GxxExxY protein
LVLYAEDLTRAAIAAFYRVYDRLGFGFLESVYVGALVVELERAGYRVQREAPIAVHYDGVAVGNYRADLLVDDRLILEVKTDTNPAFSGAERQLRNYLKCSNIEVGLLLVFGLKPRFKRLIHTQDRKNNY